MKSLKKALTNIRRTPYQSMAATLVLSITFFIALIFSFASVSIYRALKYFEAAPQVLIFYQTNVTREAIEIYQQQLLSDPSVTSVVFTPKEKALDIYKELNKNDPLLLELVTADILPASLEVSTIDLESLKRVASQASGHEGVDEVVLRTDVIDLLGKWLTGIKIAGGLFIGIMAMASVITVGIVVGMKISGKNYEIQVLKLIGASGWYIQGPYLIEGALYGLFGSLFAYISALTALLYATPVILQFAGEVPLLPSSPQILGIIAISSLVSGFSVGLIGSFFAVIRFMHR